MVLDQSLPRYKCTHLEMLGILGILTFGGLSLLSVMVSLHYASINVKPLGGGGG